MTIRARLTLWYAAILCASTLLIAGLSYREFLKEARVAHGNIVDGDAEQDGWEDVVEIAIVCGLPAAVLGLAGGWWLMRKSMAPVTALTETTKRISDSNLKERLPRTGNGDEFDKLTEVFNSMTARLDDSFQRIRQFTLHASHELKTPLTIMQGELETALREENLDEIQRDRIVSQLDEIQRLTGIVDGLTLLTKADAGQVQLKFESVRLDELVRESYEDAKILAQPGKVQVQLKRCDELNITADRHRLRQLLLNLTDNAIKYNRPCGIVEMELSRKDGEAEIKISNTGEGVAPENLPRVFDRFFRGDESHSNTIEGCGLGLSIAQWITHAHGGKIQITSESDKTILIVRLRSVTEAGSFNTHGTGMTQMI